MKAFGSKTPKRTVVYANTRHIKQLDCGPMKREALTSSVRTTKTYMSKKGQKRFSGSENLKGTQFLDTYHLGNYDVFFYCTFLLNLEFVDDGPQKEQNPLVKCLWDLGFTRGNTSRKSWNSTGMPRPKNEMPFQLCLNKWPWIWFCICILGVGDI